MARLTPKILNLSDSERDQLQQLINRHNMPRQIAIRAKIILMASEGQNHREIARNLDINRQMARLWRNRWLETDPKDLSIHQRLKQEYGQEIEYGTVYSLVRYTLGAKLKVPRPQSHKQDEKLVSEFKKNSVLS